MLDVARFVCIASVIAFHYTVRFEPPIYPSDVPLHGVQFPSWLVLGKFGVQVFFVISGFVIAETLSRCATVGEFAWRRFSRLYPAFVLCATLTFLCLQILEFPPKHITLFAYLGNIALANMALQNVPWVDGVYWSLGVEVWFYFIIATCWALSRPNFWIAFAAFVTAMAIFAPTVSRLPLAHMPLFLVGIGLWVGFGRHERMASIGLIVLAVVLYVHLNPWLDAEIAVFIAGMTTALAGGLAICPQLKLGIVSELGRCSYAAYLIHQVVGIAAMRFLAERFEMPVGVKIALVTITVYAVAVLITRAVERPAEAWLRSRLRFSRSSAGLSPAET